MAYEAPVIIRKQVIVVEGQDYNDKGDLMVKAKGINAPFKLGMKRTTEYANQFIIDRAVELSFATFKGYEYIASAKLVDIQVKMDAPVQPYTKTEVASSIPKAEPSHDKKEYKADPAKTSSIERQVAAKIACEFSDQETLAGRLQDAEIIYQWISEGKLPPVPTPSVPEKPTPEALKPPTPSVGTEKPKPPHKKSALVDAAKNVAIAEEEPIGEEN